MLLGYLLRLRVEPPRNSRVMGRVRPVLEGQAACIAVASSAFGECSTGRIKSDQANEGVSVSK